MVVIVHFIENEVRNAVLNLEVNMATVWGNEVRSISTGWPLKSVPMLDA